MLRTLPLIIREFALSPKSPAELQALRGAPTREIVRAIGAPTWKIPFIARRLRQMSEASAGEIALFPGASDLLGGLRAAGVATAVVSSNSEAAIKGVLGEGTLRAIDHLDCGAALFGKASRLRKLTRRFGVAPAEAVYVGDETRDIEAARRAALDSVAVSWGYATREVLADQSPSALVGTISELKLRLGI